MLRGVDNPHTRAFRLLAAREVLVIGDIVMLEVLQGSSGEAQAARTEAWLRAFTAAPMLSAAAAPRVAALSRRLRGQGLTVRSLTDLVIAGWCIAQAVPLLHRDRDFDRMAGPLGLAVQPV